VPKDGAQRGVQQVLCRYDLRMWSVALRVDMSDDGLALLHRANDFTLWTLLPGAAERCFYDRDGIACSFESSTPVSPTCPPASA